MGFRDDPAFPGELPAYRNGRVISLQGLLNEWGPGVASMWTCYIVDAKSVAVAAGLMTHDTPVDFSDVPRWELIKKEAKDHK